MAEHLLILTPGNVFCSWRACCALMALSRTQYVKKAQPVDRKQTKKLNHIHQTPQWFNVSIITMPGTKDLMHYAFSIFSLHKIMQTPPSLPLAKSAVSTRVLIRLSVMEGIQLVADQLLYQISASFCLFFLIKASHAIVNHHINFLTVYHRRHNRELIFLSIRFSLLVKVLYW